MEQALADIQFLGDPEQIALAQKFARNLSTAQEASMDDLLFSLRNALRRELGLTRDLGRIVWLKIERAPKK